MKRKHHGLVAVCLIFTTLFATGVYAFHTFKEAGKKVHINRMKSLPDIIVPNQAEIREMGMLENKINTLVFPVESGRKTANLILFGYQPFNNKAGHPSRKSPATVKSDYSVTFAFYSKNNRFCIINGELYTEGAILPGGEKIAKIEPKRVLINKHRLGMWIPLVARNIDGRTGK